MGIPGHPGGVTVGQVSTIAPEPPNPVPIMTPVQTTPMILDTFDESTAVDLLVLPLWHRNVEIDWRSGSSSTVPVRRRDQLRLIWSHLTDLDLSYGQWANWTMGRLNPAL